MTAHDSSHRIAQKIVERCNTNPPQDVDGHPDIFSDLEDDRMHEALMKMWQKGVLVAEWDEESEETAWALSEFGVELGARGLIEPYIEATEDGIEIDAGPGSMEDLKQ